MWSQVSETSVSLRQLGRLWPVVGSESGLSHAPMQPQSQVWGPETEEGLWADEWSVQQG